MKLLRLSAIYESPATDAVVMNPDGTVNGPANPELFSSQAEGMELIHDLERSGILTVKRASGYVVHLLDRPETEDGNFRYGKDGRKVLVVLFPRDGQTFEVNAQELYIEMKRLPAPGSKWAIVKDASGAEFLIRQGAIVGANWISAP